MPTSAEIDTAIQEVVAETESLGSLPGVINGYIYEGTDGLFVVCKLTAYEAYQIDKMLYGQEIADYNYSQLSKPTKAY